MRILPRAQREAMFEIYSFCRAVDDIADDHRPARSCVAGNWPAGGPTSTRSIAARRRRTSPAWRRRCAGSICNAKTSSPSSTAWRWTSSPTSALPIAQRSTSIAIAWPARSDGCRCACSAWSADAGLALAHHLGRALQLTNILRDLDEDAALGRLYLPREALQAAGIAATEPRDGSGASGDRQGLRRHRRAGARATSASKGDHGAKPAPRRAGAADHGRGLSHHPRRHWWRAALRRRARRFACRASNCCSSCCAISCDAILPMTATVHIIGAGLAGLSAALKLSARGRRVIVHEATAFAGGRCRSYHDASVGMTIDNGNHLLLSGNRAALDYLRSIGAANRLVGPPTAEFPFVDLAERRTLDAALQRRPRCRSGCSIRTGACRARARSIICRWRASVGAAGQSGRRGHRLRRNALSPAGRAAAARSAQYRSAAGIGTACGRDHPRDARRRRPRLPAADCA